MNKQRKTNLIFWLFLAPVLFTFIMVIVIPFFMGIFYSFTNWSSSARADSTLQFVGLANFKNSFQDPSFIYSFIITSLYTVLNVLFINAVALILALVVTSRLKLKNIYRVGFFIPNLIGGLVLGYIWQFIFNNAIPALGNIIPVLDFLSNPDNLVLSKVGSSVTALVIVGTWQYAGYIMMIYVAAIEGVPESLFEAATIDGANEFQKFKNITVPMVAQAFTITMFLTLVQSFKQFDVNVSLTAGGPSAIFRGTPLFGTELLSLNIYNTAFVKNMLAEGQARAVVFFVVLVVISVIQVSINKKKEVEL
ncbi:MAG: sugar ABC transporter permease [Spirochaetes bacterium]|nr:MAG: sugar ABC transporter permease [Spirochaetota bacterium]